MLQELPECTSRKSPKPYFLFHSCTKVCTKTRLTLPWGLCVCLSPGMRTCQNTELARALETVVCSMLYLRQNTLFFSRANFSGLGKNWVELDFFLEVAYLWQCIFNHVKLTKLRGAVQQLQLLLLPNTTSLLDYFFPLPSMTTAAHATAFSISFPSSRGQWHLFAWFRHSRNWNALVTEKAFEASVFYFFT